ncbi:MAG: PEGA domain-containing protein [Acidobacteriota bacterium]
MTKMILAKTALVVGGLLAMLPGQASAARVFLGGGFRTGVVIGPGWGYPYGGYGAVYGGQRTGQLKFDTPNKDAQVFINGAYAGTVRELKTTHLRPGTYDIQVQRPGAPNFAQRIYIVAGKTLHVRP